MDKNTVSEILNKALMIPVFYNADLEASKGTIKACYDGGLRVFEYVNRGAAAVDNFPHLLAFVEAECPGMLLGIGSITSAQQAKQFIDMGAPFIVAPIFDPPTGAVCKENDTYWVPGCGTLSEMKTAVTLGADIVKLFPADVYGPAFIKAVLGPCSDLKIMPTGGVAPTKENLSTWFGAGAVCVGMGSQLFDKTLIAEGKFEELSNNISAALDIVNEIKS
jgi:2-dehydro-3-deoxyphosphogluconate aldolase/(4S)-4-hydroxy-2-oxoglutarate aldolase